MLSDRLDAFLALPAVDTITATVTLPRIGQEITVRAMTEAAFQEIRREAREAERRHRTDTTNILVVEGQCVDPDFSNTEFLKKAGYALGRDFISAKLLPGEIATIADKVIEISGFNRKEDDEEAKNS